MSISAIGCFFQKLQPTDSLIKPANIDSFTALHFRYHRFSTSHTSRTSHTGRVALPGAGGRGEVHSGRHSSWHGRCPAGLSSGVDLLDEGRCLFSKSQGPKVEVVLQTMDEIWWNSMKRYALSTQAFSKVMGSQACWAQDPLERPSFTEVLRQIEALHCPWALQTKSNIYV